jgi:hypothetical protein
MSSEKVQLDLPSELIEAGQILLVERASEIFVDGCHLPQLTNPILETQHFCLYQGEQHSTHSSAEHLSQSDTSLDCSGFFQLVVELMPEMFNRGTTIAVEQRAKTNDSAVDLSAKKFVHIGIAREDLQRGKIIAIEQTGPTSMRIEKDPTKLSQHLHENFFTRRDHLQSKGLMQIRIKVDPDFFLIGSVLSFKKEDLKSINEHFAYRRASKSPLADNHQVGFTRRSSLFI